MSKIHMVTILSFLSIVYGVVTSSEEAKSAPLCKEIFLNSFEGIDAGSISDETSALLEPLRKQISNKNSQLKSLETQKLEVMSQIDSGGADWKQISPNLVKSISERVKELQNTFGVPALDRAIALARIKFQLSNSSEFGTLSSEDIDGMTKSLENSFDSKLFLYRELKQKGLTHSAQLNDLLLQFVTIERQEAAIQTARNPLLNAMNELSNNPDVKDATSLQELEDLYESLQSDINNKSLHIPLEVINSLVFAAKKFKMSSGALDLLTAGHREAIEQYNHLVSTQSYFKNFSPDQLDLLRQQWTSMTTQQSAINILVGIENLKLSESLYRMQKLQRAIQYFESTPR